MRKIFVTLALMGWAASSWATEYRTLGVFAGGSFPRFLFGRAQLNLFESWAVDYQGSIGIFWTVQQGDAYYFFSRGDWSPYGGLGYQFWNFYGFNSSTSSNGIVPGVSNQAGSITLPLGLLYIAPSGFALDLNVAADVFIWGSDNLVGKVMPEGQVAIGYFF